MPSIESPETVTSARKLYGDEGAARLWNDVIEWHGLASAEYGIDPRSAINVELGVNERAAGAYFEPSDGSINLLVPLRLDREALAQVPIVMLHENAHRKRHEIISQCWWEHDDPRDQLFCSFVDEGLATLAEGVLLGGESSDSFTEEEQRQSQFIDGLLLDLLFFTKINSGISSSKRERYMYGTPVRLPSRSNRVGHYIVARAFLLNNLTMSEALTLPDQFYREFAEECL